MSNNKQQALQDYRKKFREHEETEKRLKDRKLRHFLWLSGDKVRLSIRDLERQYDKSEQDIKALQSVGQIIGETLKQLDDERCMHSFF